MPSASPLSLTAHRRALVLPGDRVAGTVAFESDVVDFFVRATALLGVPKSIAAIYGIVFASPAPLSFADIGARLDLSKGSVSQGLRTLREVGAIQEVSKPEDPAELFAPDLEIRRLIGRYLTARIDPELRSGRDRLDKLQAGLAARTISDQKLLTGRLKKLQRWHSRARALLPIINTFLDI